MVRIRRRDLMIGAGAMAAVAWLGRRSVVGTGRADTSGASPRYWINVIPAGGLDAVSTTDPRTRRTVNAGVDVPYGPDQIVQVGDQRFGPHFAPLVARAGQLAVVNGILVNTANHYTGVEQAQRLRTRTTIRTPAVFDIIGAHRDGQAVGHFTLAAPLRQAQTTDFIGTVADGDFGGSTDLLAQLDTLEPSELAELAKAVSRQIASVRRGGALSSRERKAVDAMGQVRALFERAASVPRFASESWLTGEFATLDALDLLGPQLRRALWLIEHDLAAAVTVYPGNLAWDSHQRNTVNQEPLNRVFAATLERFMAALETRQNRHGRLADQTAFLIGSEIGRFPYLNLYDGKDHFPQIPMLFGGPGFRVGSRYGATGRELEALAVSIDSGLATSGSERIVLDDVGHTILRMAGIQPSLYGVAGRDLTFLHREPT